MITAMLTEAGRSSVRMMAMMKQDTDVTKLLKTTVSRSCRCGIRLERKKGAIWPKRLAAEGRFAMLVDAPRRWHNAACTGPTYMTGAAKNKRSVAVTKMIRLRRSMLGVNSLSISGEAGSTLSLDGMKGELQEQTSPVPGI